MLTYRQHRHCATCCAAFHGHQQLVTSVKPSSAAQSIGEPRQLTMRTFHQGGVGEDIAGGLPRCRSCSTEAPPVAGADRRRLAVRLEDGEQFSQGHHRSWLTVRKWSDKDLKRQRVCRCSNTKTVRAIALDGDHVEVRPAMDSADPHECCGLEPREGADTPGSR